jgi:hypothetical protein
MSFVPNVKFLIRRDFSNSFGFFARAMPRRAGADQHRLRDSGDRQAAPETAPNCISS